MAIVQDQASRTIDDIINEIANRGATVTKADILSVIEEYQAVIAKFLKNGDRINTPFFRTSDSISGVFENQTDSFDRSRYYVRLNVNPGSRIGEIAENLSVEKVAATRVDPVLELFKDFAGDTQNDTVTPGGAAELRGSSKNNICIYRPMVQQKTAAFGPGLPDAHTSSPTTNT